MNQIAVTEELVKIEIKGWEKLWSFKGELKIPRKAIAKAYRRPMDMKPPWLRTLDTHLPKVIAAGTYRGSDRKEFWNTRFNDDCVVFVLRNFDYTPVVIDATKVDELIDQLSQWTYRHSQNGM